MFTAICKRIGVWVVQKDRLYLLLGALCLLGSVTLTANAILTVSNSGMFGDADVTVDSAGTLNVGTAASTAVVIGKTGTPVTIPGNVAINGTLTLGSASTTGQLLFHIASSSFTTLLQASSSQASNLTFTLPTTSGTAGQAMLTDGAGNLFFGNLGSSQWLNGTSGTISYNSGSIGINTTTPLALLSIVGSASSTAPLFDIASSSGTSLFRVSPTGTVTVGTKVLAGAVTVQGMATPQVTITQSGSAGSTKYNYCVTGSDAASNTRSVCSATALGNATLSGSNYNIVTIPAWSSASPYVLPVGSCNVYRTVGGATVGVIGTIATCASGGNLHDTGLAGDTTTHPADTSGAVAISGPITQPLYIPSTFADSNFVMTTVTNTSAGNTDDVMLLGYNMRRDDLANNPNEPMWYDGWESNWLIAGTPYTERYIRASWDGGSTYQEAFYTQANRTTKTLGTTYLRGTDIAFDTPTASAPYLDCNITGCNFWNNTTVNTLSVGPTFTVVSSGANGPSSGSLHIPDGIYRFMGLYNGANWYETSNSPAGSTYYIWWQSAGGGYWYITATLGSTATGGWYVSGASTSTPTTGWTTGVFTGSVTVTTSGGAGTIISAGTIQIAGMTTVTGLPTCNLAAVGTRATVSDANSATPGATAAGSGTYMIAVQCIGNSTGPAYTWIID
jgi:hypothetical protein